MAKIRTIQIYRGTTAQNDAYTGSAGELTMDTTTNEIRIHDGSTAGGHTLANKATTLAGYGITDGANTDLSNLTSVGQNVSTWSSNVSNCITEIPQDIKLELSSGTLTLKAGSKVYVPNGSGVFDTYTISSDTNIGVGTGSQTKLIFIKNNGTVATRTISTCYSGSSAPSGQTYMAWYDTTNNLVKLTSDSGSTWTSGYSLPVGIFTMVSNAPTSIDQVFNGFGYIGVSWFMLPGVKGLVSNGLNDDGTCKSIAFTNPSVYTYNSSTTTERIIAISVNSSGNITNAQNAKTTNVLFGLGKDKPLTVRETAGFLYYATDENLWYTTSGSTTANWNKAVCLIFGKRNGTSTSFTSFEINSVFHSLDFSNKDIIVNWGMPDYSSATTISSYPYTVLYDGFVFIYTKRANDQTTNIKINGTQVGYSQSYYSNIQYFFPVSRGDIISSDNSGNLQQGLFYPLKGVL